MCVGARVQMDEDCTKYTLSYLEHTYSMDFVIIHFDKALSLLLLCEYRKGRGLGFGVDGLYNLLNDTMIMNHGLIMVKFELIFCCSLYKCTFVN